MVLIMCVSSKRLQPLPLGHLKDPVKGQIQHVTTDLIAYAMQGNDTGRPKHLPCVCAEIASPA